MMKTVLVAILIEGAVCKWQHMRFERFEQFKMLVLLLFQFHDEF